MRRSATETLASSDVSAVESLIGLAMMLATSSVAATVCSSILTATAIP